MGKPPRSKRTFLLRVICWWILYVSVFFFAWMNNKSLATAQTISRRSRRCCHTLTFVSVPSRRYQQQPDYGKAKYKKYNFFSNRKPRASFSSSDSFGLAKRHHLTSFEGTLSKLSSSTINDSTCNSMKSPCTTTTTPMPVVNSQSMAQHLVASLSPPQATCTHTANNLHDNFLLNSVRLCMGIAGGGGGALSALSATPGASRTLLEGILTYDRDSFHQFVRGGIGDDHNHEKDGILGELRKVYSRNVLSTLSKKDQPPSERGNDEEEETSVSVKHVSYESALALANASLYRAIHLSSQQPHRRLSTVFDVDASQNPNNLKEGPSLSYQIYPGLSTCLGVGSTSALASTGEREGRQHVCFIATMGADGVTRLYKCVLTREGIVKNNRGGEEEVQARPRTRGEEEKVVSGLMLGTILEHVALQPYVIVPLQQLQGNVESQGKKEEGGLDIDATVSPLKNVLQDTTEAFLDTDKEELQSRVLLPSGHATTIATTLNTNTKSAYEGSESIAGAVQRVVTGMSSSALVLPTLLRQTHACPTHDDKTAAPTTTATTITTNKVQSMTAMGMCASTLLKPRLALNEDEHQVGNILVFPGSFNPVHEGHVALANAAVKRWVELQQKASLEPRLQKQTLFQWDSSSGASPENGKPAEEGCSVLFEMSLTNADKPPLQLEDVMRRMDAFVRYVSSTSAIVEDKAGVSMPEDWAVMLTDAPLFSQKVEVLLGSSSASSTLSEGPKVYPKRVGFVIGTDTMLRILHPKYYNNSEEEMLEAVRGMGRQGVHFVVGGRMEQGTNARPVFVSGHEEWSQLPTDVQSMFTLLREDEFRVDLSSTEVRRRNMEQ